MTELTLLKGTAVLPQTRTILTVVLLQTAALALLAIGLLDFLEILRNMALMSCRSPLIVVLKPTGETDFSFTGTAGQTPETPQEVV